MNWDDLLREITPEAPGCPEPLALAALKDAAADFCERTLLWRVEIGPLDVTAGRAEYRLVPPAGARVAMVLAASLDGRRLSPISEEALDADYPFWAAVESPCPDRYCLTRPDTLRLVPVPARDMPASLKAVVALKPGPGSSACPDELADGWTAPLTHGARARLMLMTGQSWSAPEGADHHDRQFRAAVVQARGQRLKGRSMASLSARWQAFA